MSSTVIYIFKLYRLLRKLNNNGSCSCRPIVCKLRGGINGFPHERRERERDNNGKHKEQRSEVWNWIFGVCWWWWGTLVDACDEDPNKRRLMITLTARFLGFDHYSYRLSRSIYMLKGNYSEAAKSSPSFRARTFGLQSTRHERIWLANFALST